jgi:hypothetical protein
MVGVTVQVFFDIPAPTPLVWKPGAVDRSLPNLYTTIDEVQDAAKFVAGKVVVQTDFALTGNTQTITGKTLNLGAHVEFVGLPDAGGNSPLLTFDGGTVFDTPTEAAGFDGLILAVSNGAGAPLFGPGVAQLAFRGTNGETVTSTDGSLFLDNLGGTTVVLNGNVVLGDGTRSVFQSEAGIQLKMIFATGTPQLQGNAIATPDPTGLFIFIETPGAIVNTTILSQATVTGTTFLVVGSPGFQFGFPNTDAFPTFANLLTYAQSLVGGGGALAGARRRGERGHPGGIFRCPGATPRLSRCRVILNISSVPSLRFLVLGHSFR